jgi:hypothetical protein
LRTYLLAAYRLSADVKFTAYIDKLQDKIREQRRRYTPKEIMSKAQLKVQALEKQKLIYGDNLEADSPDNIVALQTQVEEQSRQINNLTNQISSGGKRDQQRKSPKDRKGKSRFPKELETAGKPDDITKAKTIDGKEYWYCPTHKWCRHPYKPQGDHKGCRERKAAPSGANPSGGTKPSDKKAKRMAMFAQFMSQVVDSDSD